MFIYLDESGDLGFRAGGSKYFVITFISVTNNLQLERTIREVKSKYGLHSNYEIKGSSTTARIKNELLQKISKLNIEIYSIVMNKSKVFSRIKDDKNILYNYVLGLILVPYIINQQDVDILVDRRTVSVRSGFKLDDYLEYKVWYENLADVNMNISHEDSKHNLGIQVVDVISYAIFRKYESGDVSYYNLIRHRIKKEIPLFF